MIITALLSVVLAVTRSDTTPAAVAEYPRRAHVEEVKAPGYTGYTLEYDTLRSSHVLAPLVNRNRRYFSYLAQNCPNAEPCLALPQRNWKSTR